MTDERLAEIKARLEAATAGPWCWNGYSAVHSAPMIREFDRLAEEVPDDAPDAAYDHLPEFGIVTVPRAYGDTATIQGAKDAQFIAASWQDVTDLLDEVMRLREHACPTLDTWKPANGEVAR